MSRLGRAPSPLVARGSIPFGVEPWILKGTICGNSWLDTFMEGVRFFDDEVVSGRVERRGSAVQEASLSEDSPSRLCGPWARQACPTQGITVIHIANG